MADITQAFDISAVGTIISFSRGLTCDITNFADEGTPFDAPDVDASTNRKNLNGTMISSRTPSVYPFSVTVIPGSPEDDKLWAFLQKSLIQPGGVASIPQLLCDCTIKVPDINASGRRTGSRSYTYSNCRIKSGPTGPSTSAEGRLSARTYTFEAESLKRS